MQVSISNVIINYFLTHTQVQILTKDKLSLLVKKIQNTFSVKVSDFSESGIKQTTELFSDFLKTNQKYDIIQNNILMYLQDLQPVYGYLSFNLWDKQYQYYKLIRQF